MQLYIIISALLKLITDANDKNFQPRAPDTNHAEIFCDNNSAQSVPHLRASPALSFTLLVEDLEKPCWSVAHELWLMYVNSYRSGSGGKCHEYPCLLSD